MSWMETNKSAIEVRSVYLEFDLIDTSCPGDCVSCLGLRKADKSFYAATKIAAPIWIGSQHAPSL